MKFLFLFITLDYSVSSYSENVEDLLNRLSQEQGLPITLETIPRRSRYPTATEFQLMCVPETFFRHQRDSTVFIESSDGQFSFGNISLAEVNEEFIRGNILLSLPSFVNNYFVNVLSQGGVGIDFYNCTENVLNTLPGINIQFDLGRIDLFGSDLFSHDPVTNTCSPRYTVSDNDNFIVPQLFPDISVAFVDNGEMYLCQDVGDDI